MSTTVSDIPLVKRIYSVNPEILHREIKAWDKENFMRLQPFVKEHYWQGHATINVFRVTGTQHPDYQGMTWLEFLCKGKRMTLNHSLYEDNPDYYDECGKKEPTMYFQSIDGGDLYIGQDGNHRTAIAKAVFYLDGDPSLHGVEVNDYRIDWELKRLYEKLLGIVAKRRLSYQVSPVCKAISRDDTGGWMIEKYETKVKVVDLSKQTEFLFDTEELKVFVGKQKKKSILNRVFFFV